MEEKTKEILIYLGNIHTKVEKKVGFKGNYYSNIIDTIYLGENIENQDLPKSMQNINKKTAEIITICHECIHSVQARWLHILNTIFSNLTIILFLLCSAFGLLGTCQIYLKFFAIAIIFSSILIRLILEIGAINGSIELSANILEAKIINDISEQDIKAGIKYIEKYKLLALLQMIIDKILFLVLLIIIK